MTLEEIGSRAKAVSRTLNNLGSREKNIGLEEAARALLEGEEEILAANQAGPVRPPCFKSGPDPVHGRWPFKSSCLR